MVVEGAGGTEVGGAAAAAADGWTPLQRAQLASELQRFDDDQNNFFQLGRIRKLNRPHTGPGAVVLPRLNYEHRTTDIKQRGKNLLKLKKGP